MNRHGNNSSTSTRVDSPVPAESIRSSTAATGVAQVGVQQWFDGIYLLGQFNWLQTGCWLLVQQGEGAILEMPPPSLKGPSPAAVAQKLVSELSITSVKYLLCTHSHPDH